MNSVNIIGNIGHDLELRHTGSGKAVLNMNIAVNDYHDEVHWFRIVLWNKQAENTMKYCGKGSKVAISGRLSTSKYNDNSGKEIVNTEIVAVGIDFLSHQDDQKKESNYSNNSNDSKSMDNQKDNNFTQTADHNPFVSNVDAGATEISDDDLPFWNKEIINE